MNYVMLNMLHMSLLRPVASSIRQLIAPYSKLSPAYSHEVCDITSQHSIHVNVSHIKGCYHFEYYAGDPLLLHELSLVLF